MSGQRAVYAAATGVILRVVDPVPQYLDDGEAIIDAPDGTGVGTHEVDVSGEVPAVRSLPGDIIDA